MQVFAFRISVSIAITANKPFPLLFRLALPLNVLQKPSWPLQGGCAVLVGEHQGDGSETKQSSVIHGDIFPVSGKDKYTRMWSHMVVRNQVLSEWHWKNRFVSLKLGRGCKQDPSNRDDGHDPPKGPSDPTLNQEARHCSRCEIDGFLSSAS